jgi:hypothetical protein
VVQEAATVKDGTLSESIWTRCPMTSFFDSLLVMRIRTGQLIYGSGSLMSCHYQMSKFRRW